MKYKIVLDEDGYLSAVLHTDTEEDLYEIELDTLDLEYFNCYKLLNGKLVFDKEKYQKMLAKKEFIETETSDTEVINGYRIIKYSNYNFLVASDVLLWIIICLTLIVKIAKVWRNKIK